MRDYLVPFCGAFVLFGLTFFLLDLVVMNLQGLGLVFHR